KGTEEDLEPYVSRNYSQRPVFLGELPMAGRTSSITELNSVRNLLPLYRLERQGAVYKVIKR
ncbi:MAG: hypothetical protein ACE5GM_07275, partial [bacterium]